MTGLTASVSFTTDIESSSNFTHPIIRDLATDNGKNEPDCEKRDLNKVRRDLDIGRPELDIASRDFDIVIHDPNVEAQGETKVGSLHELATELENIFHVRSAEVISSTASGLDIVVSDTTDSNTDEIIFMKMDSRTPLVGNNLTDCYDLGRVNGLHDVYSNGDMPDTFNTSEASSHNECDFLGEDFDLKCSLDSKRSCECSNDGQTEDDCLPFSLNNGITSVNCESPSNTGLHIEDSNNLLIRNQQVILHETNLSKLHLHEMSKGSYIEYEDGVHSTMNEDKQDISNLIMCDHLETIVVRRSRLKICVEELLTSQEAYKVLTYNASSANRLILKESNKSAEFNDNSIDVSKYSGAGVIDNASDAIPNVRNKKSRFEVKKVSELQVTVPNDLSATEQNHLIESPHEDFSLIRSERGLESYASSPHSTSHLTEYDNVCRAQQAIMDTNDELMMEANVNSLPSTPNTTHSFEVNDSLLKDSNKPIHTFYLESEIENTPKLHNAIIDKENLYKMDSPKECCLENENINTVAPSDESLVITSHNKDDFLKSKERRNSHDAVIITSLSNNVSSNEQILNVSSGRRFSSPALQTQLVSAHQESPITSKSSFNKLRENLERITGSTTQLATTRTDRSFVEKPLLATTCQGGSRINETKLSRIVLLKNMKTQSLDIDCSQKIHKVSTRSYSEEKNSSHLGQFSKEKADGPEISTNFPKMGAHAPDISTNVPVMGADSPEISTNVPLMSAHVPDLEKKLVSNDTGDFLTLNSSHVVHSNEMKDLRDTLSTSSLSEENLRIVHDFLLRKDRELKSLEERQELERHQLKELVDLSLTQGFKPTIIQQINSLSQLGLPRHLANINERQQSPFQAYSKHNNFDNKLSYVELKPDSDYTNTNLTANDAFNISNRTHTNNIANTSLNIRNITNKPVACRYCNGTGRLVISCSFCLHL